jgi:hypothetical protein
MTPEICIPKKDTETVIQINRGPFWDGERWVWSYFAFWWDNSPAICGKCGNCTNPNNVPPCGHPEAKRHVRGQVFVSSLEDHERRAHEGGRTIRYVRDGKTIDDSTARQTPKVKP